MFACTESPQPGLTTTTTVSQVAATSISIWPDADRLDDHERPSGGIEQPDGFGHGRREPAQMAPGRHGADEDRIVQGVLLHAHPVTEDGAAGHGRGRVDRQHRNRFGEALSDARSTGRS